MRDNPVRRKITAGQTAFGTMAFEFFTPGLAPTLAAAGAEFIVLDMEHSGAGIDTMKAQIAFAKAAGIVPMVRVPGCVRHLVTTVLDAGALGVMVPFIETPEQAAALASWCRYRPLGTRGLAFGVAHDDYRPGPARAAMAAANEEVLTIAQIESARGVENAEAILSVPGIDLGWIGHFDLSDSLGCLEDFDAGRYRDAEQSVLAAAQRSGTPMGWLAPNAAAAREALRKGYTCIGIGTDIALLRGALASEFDALKD